MAELLHSKNIADRFLVECVNADVSTVVTGKTGSGNTIMEKTRFPTVGFRYVPTYSKEDFIRKGTMTAEMFDFLASCFANGLSTAFTGCCGAGKTAAMASFLKTLSDERKIVIVEKDFQEMCLGSGNLVHWIADEYYSVKELLTLAVDEKPDVICIGELQPRDVVARLIMDLCQAGQFMTTVVHANSCRGMYQRMTTCCQMLEPNADLDVFPDALYKLCVSSFPIGVHIRKMDDGVRRVTQISESYINSDGEPVINLLYKYDLSLYESFGEKIEGEFIRVNEPSEGLKKRLLGFNFDEK